MSKTNLKPLESTSNTQLRNLGKLQISSSSSESESVSIDSEFNENGASDKEIEVIKTKNRILVKKVVDRIMSFKHSSRVLINLEAHKTQPIFAFVNKNSGESMYETPEKPLQKEFKYELDHSDLMSSIQKINKLNTQHRRVKSELVQNLEEIEKVDIEKRELQSELIQLENQFILESRNVNNTCCVII